MFKKIKGFFINIFGSKIDEIYWNFRHIFNSSWAKKYISEESISHPHRKFLIEKIAAHFPFQSCLEIGCASGPNLFLLAQKFPGVSFYGIDISNNAIKEGKRFLEDRKIKNVTLINSRADNLKFLKDKSIDIVFSDAILIYIDKNKIKYILKEMTRIAKKLIIILELCADRVSYYDGHWIHNYKSLFRKLISNKKIKISRIPKEIWDGSWKKQGCIIEVVL
ncbi:MAG: hypothetical protein A3F15_00350 [Candidatus Wildermuthbacteria bacterium RIFCSPHIGHO2_12_FULL_40_12]|uniref:Methyltransferase domain-containing protein n=1 Tax=Candidatus Wildermuthbacteria bacterium RIFCSPHIGHO2_12_FULL_40_12 TaxID=1802457 RepID=A0A1G2RBE9_9BACT|nr:MAG: hypothetical protein A3F15_00350 [Candidatus Wildermuthbacteria bacterium RIFCSPHIGHO2_12_FULL_40_12]